MLDFIQFIWCTILRYLNHWQHAVAILLLVQLVFAATLGLRTLPLVETVELDVYDLLLSIKAKREPFDSRLVLVYINDEDQRRYGWPLNDHTLLNLFHTLLAQQARVIGLDIYRDLPVPLQGSVDYQRLTDLFRTEDRIIGIQKIRDIEGAQVDPPLGLIGTGRLGFNDITIDADGISRRGLFYLTDGSEHLHQAFSFKLAEKFLPQKHLVTLDTTTQIPMMGVTPLPTTLTRHFGGYQHVDLGGYQFMLSYPAAPTPFHHISVSDTLNGRYPPSFFRDKLVIIGTNARATPDFITTPFTDREIPGVAVHAYITSQLLRMAEQGTALPLNSLNDWQELLWIWLWTMIAALLCLWRQQSVWWLLLVLCGGVASLSTVVFYSFMYGWWLPSTPPLLGWLLSLMVVTAYLAYQEHHQRNVLMGLFCMHVSEDVANVIWQARDQYLNHGKLRPQRLYATVLFTDLQGFTSVSESMDPQALMDWLNEYMDHMVDVVEQHNGQVNKFIGDALMAVFGVPVERHNEAEIANDAANAIDCALAMQREMERLRAQWQQAGMPDIRMRVGIFTGMLVAGSLGGKKRQEYTVIGDTVNTAARLEGYDKTFDAENPCRILIGDATLQYVSDLYETQCVGNVGLKGKAELVTVYKVLRRMPTKSPVSVVQQTVQVA